MLSEIYPGGSPKIGSTYWDQIREVTLASVARRLIKCLKEFLEQVCFRTVLGCSYYLLAMDSKCGRSATKRPYWKGF